jgi:hypothetical protein
MNSSAHGLTIVERRARNFLSQSSAAVRSGAENAARRRRRRVDRGPAGTHEGRILARRLGQLALTRKRMLLKSWQRFSEQI